MLRVNLDFRQAHDTVGGHRLLGAHSRLLVQVQAFADNLSSGDVGIGRKLEQHGFQPCIIEFPVAVKHFGCSVSVSDGADEVVEAFGFVDVHYVALHRQRRGVDYGRAVLSPMIVEYVRFIDRCAAHAAHIVGFRQHFTTDKVDGELLRLPYPLIGMMVFAHAHENPVVADDARMPYNEPVHFALNLRTDNGHRFGIEGKQVSDILLFHFRTVLFVSLLCRLRIAR